MDNQMLNLQSIELVVVEEAMEEVVEEVKDIQKLMILVMILFLVFPLLRLQNTAGRCHT